MGILCAHTGAIGCIVLINTKLLSMCGVCVAHFQFDILLETSGNLTIPFPQYTQHPIHIHI